MFARPFGKAAGHVRGLNDTDKEAEEVYSIAHPWINAAPVQGRTAGINEDIRSP